MAAIPQQLSDFTQASMAEYNLFLGTARKSVGDVTLMRRAGRQIARVRLRTISNPKSEAQAIQRNFVAPVARFYAPFKKVLARSFEGLNKDQSYNKFLSTNVDLAKRQQWFLTKGATWHPMPYQLSAGTLTALKYTIVDRGGLLGLDINIGVYSSQPTTIGGLSTIFTKIGCKSNDVVTIIYVNQGEDGTYTPHSFQYIINTNDARSIATVTNGELTFLMYDDDLDITSGSNDIVAGAVLVARKADGMWKRSTQFLACSNAIVADLISQEARDAAIASYQTPGSEEGGGVYPGGDDNLFNVAAEDGRALLFIGGQYAAQTDSSSGDKRIMVKPDNYDQYYYIKLGNVRFIGTNSAGSLYPPDWRAVGGTPAPATQSNTIDCPEGSQMWLYLQSIGWTGV